MRSGDFIIENDCAEYDPRDLFENTLPRMVGELGVGRSEQDALGVSVCLWTDAVCVSNLGAGVDQHFLATPANS